MPSVATRLKKQAPAKKASNARTFSDTAVRTKTGKSWEEWFRVLDTHGAHKLDHKSIAAMMYRDLGCSRWWSQMITVEYERKHGLRALNQSCAGDFQLSCSKTLPLPLDIAYTALADEKRRAKWLPKAPIAITKANANKNVRMKWQPDGSSVEARFYAKGPGKTQVVFDHSKLPEEKSVAKMRSFWADALDRLGAAFGT